MEHDLINPLWYVVSVISTYKNIIKHVKNPLELNIKKLLIIFKCKMWSEIDK